MPADADRVAMYRETIRSAWSHGDANTWPVKLNAALHLFAKEFGEELIDDLVRLEASGLTLAEIARPFYNPARLYRLIDTTVYSMRRNRYSVADQRTVVVKLLDLARALKYGSEFNEDGANTIYDPCRAAGVGDTLRGRAACSAAQSQLVHRFCAVMWAYTESIFFRAHDVTKEIHGPYLIADGSRFIVKEYLNLHPSELWPDVPLLPCRTVVIVKQYAPGVRVRIDALNHLYHEGAPLVANLRSCLVEVDGRPTDPEGLLPLLESARETVAAISRKIEGSSWNERVLKYADIFWFRKKPLCDLVGRDWHVAPDVRHAIRSGRENERRRPVLSDEASERLAMLTI